MDASLAARSCVIAKDEYPRPWLGCGGPADLPYADESSERFENAEHKVCQVGVPRLAGSPPVQQSHLLFIAGGAVVAQIHLLYRSQTDRHHSMQSQSREATHL